MVQFNVIVFSVFAGKDPSVPPIRVIQGPTKKSTRASLSDLLTDNGLPDLGSKGPEKLSDDLTFIREGFPPVTIKS